MVSKKDLIEENWKVNYSNLEAGDLIRAMDDRIGELTAALEEIISLANETNTEEVAIAKKALSK